jgi:hypothetical protein
MFCRGAEGSDVGLAHELHGLYGNVHHEGFCPIPFTFMRSSGSAPRSNGGFLLCMETHLPGKAARVHLENSLLKSFSVYCAEPHDPSFRLWGNDING